MAQIHQFQLNIIHHTSHLVIQFFTAKKSKKIFFFLPPERTQKTSYTFQKDVQ